LRDSNNVDVTSASSFGATESGSACGASTCAITWNFSTSTSPLVISGGTSYTFTLQVNDSALGSASGSNSVSLSVTMADGNGVNYYDNSTSSGTTIALPSTIVPLNISTVSFAAGS
jgi:hypothetical protein